MADYSELKRLAEATTNCYGPMRLEIDHNGVYQIIGAGSWKILSVWNTPDGKGWNNAEFHAAASPSVVLALIATIDLLQNDTESRCEWANEASAEIDRLQNIEIERDQLKAENEALRKDAERYRFLRGHAAPSDWEYISHQAAAVIDEEVDALIDKLKDEADDE